MFDNYDWYKQTIGRRGARFVSDLPVLVESERMIYGLKGLDEWGAALSIARGRARRRRCSGMKKGRKPNHEVHEGTKVEEEDQPRRTLRTRRYLLFVASCLWCQEFRVLRSACHSLERGYHSWPQSRQCAVR